MDATLERILIATDFSACSALALEYAASLADPAVSSLRLLHVLEDPFGVADGALAEAEALMSALASSLGTAAMPVATEVRRGVPADEIVRSARENGTDLIVMGTHGRGVLRHLVLGSVAERVLHHASCPVLTVHRTPDADMTAGTHTNLITVADRMRRPVSKLLVPVDFRSTSSAVMSYAGSLASKLGAEVHLVHVIDEFLAPEVAWAPAKPAAAFCARLEDEAEARLAAVAGIVGHKKVRATYEKRLGSPATEIVASASEAAADLIVMATRTPSGTGSVSDEVVRHACCPVLTVRQTLLEEERRTNDTLASSGSANLVNQS